MSQKASSASSNASRCQGGLVCTCMSAKCKPCWLCRDPPCQKEWAKYKNGEADGLLCKQSRNYVEWRFKGANKAQVASEKKNSVGIAKRRTMERTYGRPLCRVQESGSRWLSTDRPKHRSECYRRGRSVRRRQPRPLLPSGSLLCTKSRRRFTRQGTGRCSGA